MNSQEYYKHCRSLGAFSAQDCIALARQAAELDLNAASKNALLPSVVWHESLPSGDGTLRLSNGVMCF